MPKPVNPLKKLFIAGLLALFFLLIIDSAVIFFSHQLHQAGEKPFWGDETQGIELNVRPASYGSLIIKGASGQGSPSPLDYIFVKVLDQIKDKVGYFNLKDEVYYRLVANSITTMCLVLVVLLFSFGIINGPQKFWIKLLQFILLLGVPFAFYYSRMVHYYAAEVRPYALWNSLWFVVLASFLTGKKNSKTFIVSLYLLALSATASVFQIAMLALAYFIVHFDRNKLKALVLEVSGIFLLPLLLSFYYALYSGQWAYPVLENEWFQFLELWGHKSILLAIMFGAGLLCYLRPDNKRYAVVPIASVLLYLIAPVIFYVTKHKGFFFSDRQYIYFDLTHAVFLLVAIRCLPAYLEKIKKPVFMVMCFCLIVFIGKSVALRPKFSDKFTTAFKNAWGLYADPSPIKRL